MPLQIKVARTAREIDDVFRLRQRALTPDGVTEGRFYDRFDTFPATINLVAYLSNQAEGALRVTLDGSLAFPAEDECDMRPWRECALGRDGKPKAVAFLSHLHVKPASPVRSLVVTCLLRAAGRHLRERGVMDVIGLVPPDMERHMGVGIERLGADLSIASLGGAVFPFYGSIEAFSFAQHSEPSLPPTTERLYYRDGDVIFTAGQIARCLYVVVRGRVDLLQGEGEAAVLKGTAETGEIFGEDVDDAGSHVSTAAARGFSEIGLVVSDLEDRGGDTLHDRLRRIAVRTPHPNARQEGQDRRGTPAVDLFNDYVLGRVVYALSHRGFFEFAEKRRSFGIEEAARSLDTPAAPLKVLFNYLEELGTLARDGEGYRLGEEGKAALRREMGFLEWILGGYNPALNAAEELLKAKI